MKVCKILGRRTKVMNVEAKPDFQKFMDAVSTSLSSIWCSNYVNGFFKMVFKFINLVKLVNVFNPINQNIL